MTREWWAEFWARWDAFYVPAALWLSRAAAVGAFVSIVQVKTEAAIAFLVAYVWLTLK